MTSQDRFKAFLDNIESSKPKTNAQKARTGLGYFPWRHEVKLGVRA